MVNPDFKNYGESFGIKSFKINSTKNIKHVLKTAIEADETILIEYKMSLEINTSTTSIQELQNTTK